MSGGGRHVARREDDKCASYGSLFIGQSSGTQVETKAKHYGFEQVTSNAREICFGAKSLTRFATKNSPQWKRGLSMGRKKNPRRTRLCTQPYVFVNVVVAPRYVARVQLGSGGL